MTRLLFSLLLSFTMGPLAAATNSDAAEFFDQSLGDFGEELDVARDEGKKGILLFFEMDECPFCARMKSTVLNRPDIQAFFRSQYLIFPVDIEGDLEITDFQGNPVTQKEFAKRNRVRATPVFAFYDLGGKLVARYTGATSSAEEFMWLGQYAAEGHYERMSFTRYKRERRKESRDR